MESFLGKLSKNPDCDSVSFLEADDKITAFGLVRCGFHTIRNIEALETSLGLQGVLDSDGAWSFQRLHQPFKFLSLTQVSGVWAYGRRRLLLLSMKIRAFSVLRSTVRTIWSVG